MKNACTTHGITVTVRTTYLPEHSNPREQRFVFGYHIVIENGGNYTVQLMQRNWKIVDSNGVIREVSGDGVVGRQPVLMPGQIHEYMSFCNLFSEIGKMGGFFTMHRSDTNESLTVEIPEFQMVAPSKLN
jgi:ApaG protein